MDEITEKFTGEDLRPAVEYEMKKRHQQMVKVHTKKTKRASDKEKEMSKSVYDIDWADLIKSGSLDNWIST